VEQQTYGSNKYTGKQQLLKQCCAYIQLLSHFLSFNPRHIITQTLTINIPTQRNTNVSMNYNYAVKNVVHS